MYFLTLIPLLVISFWYVCLRKRKKYRLPPGPLGLTIIGNLHQLIVKNPYEKLSQWADSCKEIYTINLSNKQAVVIIEPKLMRDILKTFPSTGKFYSESFFQITQGPYGVFNSDGKIWAEQRTFCMKNLKIFGFGNKRMESLILSEADEVCSWITNMNKKNNGALLFMQPIFLQSVINTVWTMIAGTRITLGDSKITQLMETFITKFQYTMKTGLAFPPWLKYVAPEFSGYSANNNACLDVWKYIEKEFMEHRRTFMAGAQRDLIDAYIEESGNEPIKWKHAIATVVGLFLAASESTGSTLTSLLCYLSVNPEIQRKLHEEIDTVLGENEVVSLDLKSRMPYTEAVILETLRMSTITPIGIMHQLLDDLEIHSYKFPKGLILIPNLYHCHYNKDVWGDPDVFRPQRFIDVQSEKLRSHVIPFQLGKRQCAGEPLAKDILFINVTRIFHLFNVYPDENEKPEAYYKPDIGLLLCPPSLGLFIKSRSN